MTIDKQELRILAEAACDVEAGRRVAWSQVEAKQAFIAAANPSTVLALLDELESCKRDAERMKRIIDDFYLITPGQPGCGDYSREQRTWADLKKFVEQQS